MNIVGKLNWECCNECRHFRADKGGCTPLDENGDSILRVDFECEFVRCEEFQEPE